MQSMCIPRHVNWACNQTQITRTLLSTSIRHRSDPKVWNWCLIEVDPNVFAFLENIPLCWLCYLIVVGWWKQILSKSKLPFWLHCKIISLCAVNARNIISTDQNVRQWGPWPGAIYHMKYAYGFIFLSLWCLSIGSKLICVLNHTVRVSAMYTLGINRVFIVICNVFCIASKCIIGHAYSKIDVYWIRYHL